MKTLTEMTPAELRELADLKEKMDLLFGNGTKPTVTVRVRPHWTQTPKGRKRMRLIQLKRWR